MARSRLTYAQAVKLLTGDIDAAAVLGRVVGGALLLAAPFSATALSWFDAKGEANSLLTDLVGRAPARIRASRGKSHYELIEAAHTVLVLSSYFDAFAERAGLLAAKLELTDAERKRIAGQRGGIRVGVPTMPNATRGFIENARLVRQHLVAMHDELLRFTEGLAAAERTPLPGQHTVVERAMDLYRERYVRLAADVPEFALWSGLDEHAATREAIREQREALAQISELLTSIFHGSTPATEAEKLLARHSAEGRLTRPLWTAGATAGGPVFPTIENGFVSPRFRIADADASARLGDESWWAGRPVRDDLAAFLVACVGDAGFTERPLLVLGHPGAGKSLLTEVLAARLPPETFTTVKVPLRRVDPDADVHHQIEAAVERLVKERISWGELCRASDTTKVVLLDGFDELVQATGVAQSHYIERVTSFQQEEWVNGRPVIVVVTSRTLVMDRTVVPPGTTVLQLEPFDDAQIERWIGGWNTANAGRPRFLPLTSDEFRPHAALAGQPLLLMMLAIYADETGVRLNVGDLSVDNVYRRLLDSFIRRQVREKAADDIGETRRTQLETTTRHDLAVTAFAMFNRGLQYVSEQDLESDLATVRPTEDLPAARAGEPLTRAKRTVAGFFFVHVAQAGDDSRAPTRRTYEFLHATFAEYLVAEHIVELLSDLVEDRRRPRRAALARLDDTMLRYLLSHQPLTNGDQVVPFLVAMIDRLDRTTRDDLRDALLDLFRDARRRVEDGPYRPTPFDAVDRLAAYTANLVLLAALCDLRGLAIDDLCGPSDAPSFASTVRLWRSGLDAEAQNSLFSRMHRDNDRIVSRRVEERILPLGEAQLLGDTFLESALVSGRATWGLPEASLEIPEITPVQGRMHEMIVNLLIEATPTASFSDLADLVDSSRELPHSRSVPLLKLSFYRQRHRLRGAVEDRLDSILQAASEQTEL
ncbi:hypothetical protein AB0J83_23030 [Actinoplanes sp. NPDC049596]|uniref:NACHT domain-containing protein n=1 Tax=unclassified Actinoplanes TaxID=2626549 RepID=UPI00343C5C09